MAEQTEFSSEDLVQAYAELSNYARVGGTLGQALNLEPDECEALYALGHAMYGQGRYPEAFKAFSMLVIYDHMDDRYQMALGAVCQAMGRYKDALRQYGAVGLMRLDDPTPIFHSAECMLHLGLLEDAIETLGLARLLASDDPSAHQALIARIDMMQQLLNERLDAEPSQTT